MSIAKESSLSHWMGSHKWIVFFSLMLFFVLAYAAEEALSDDFLDYLTEYGDGQGDVLDPVDLVVLEAKQQEQEQTAKDESGEQELDQ